MVTALQAFHCVLRHHALHGAPKLQAFRAPSAATFSCENAGHSIGTPTLRWLRTHAIAVERRFRKAEHESQPKRHTRPVQLGRSTGPELTLGKSPLLFCERVNLSLKSKDQKVKPRPLCTRSPWFQDGDHRWNRSQSSGCVELWTIKLLWATHEISSR